ncbi:hypothetical protein FRC16_009013 [Serendipita sp. 398]|nr:hypothetical protein FRC16_009013 [Serendipita sp. 398]
MKRSAESQLTRENADGEEDVSDTPGIFQRASERDLAKRVIRPLPKRRAGSASASPGPESSNPAANGSTTTSTQPPASVSSSNSLAPLPTLPALPSAPIGGFSFNQPSANPFASGSSAPLASPFGFGSSAPLGTAPKPAAGTVNGSSKISFGGTPSSLPPFSFGTSSTTTGKTLFGTSSKEPTLPTLPPFKSTFSSTTSTGDSGSSAADRTSKADITTARSFSFAPANTDKSSTSASSNAVSDTSKSNVPKTNTPFSFSSGSSKAGSQPSKSTFTFASGGGDKPGLSSTASSLKSTNKPGTFGLGPGFSDFSPASPNPPEIPFSTSKFTEKSGSPLTKDVTSSVNGVESDAGLEAGEIGADTVGRPYDDSSLEADLEAESRYFKHLCGLNLSFLKELTKAQKEDPFVDLSPLFQSYQTFRRDIVKEMKIAQGEGEEEQEGEEVAEEEEVDEVLEEGEEGEAHDREMGGQPGEEEETDEIIDMEESPAKPAPVPPKVPSLPFAPPAVPTGGFTFGGKTISFGATGGSSTSSTPSLTGGFVPTGFTPKFGSTASTTTSIFPSTLPTISSTIPPKPALPGFSVPVTFGFGASSNSTMPPASKLAEPKSPSKALEKETSTTDAVQTRSSGFGGGSTSVFGAPTFPSSTAGFVTAPTSSPPSVTADPASSPFNHSIVSPPIPKPVFGASFPSHGTTGPTLSTFAFPPQSQSSPDKTPARNKETEDVGSETNEEDEEGTEPKTLPAPQPPISTSRLGIANPWAKPVAGIAPAPAADSPFKFGMGAKPSTTEPTKSAPSLFSFATPPASSSASFSFAAPPPSSTSFSFADPPKVTPSAGSFINPFASPPKIGASFAAAAGLTSLGSGLTGTTNPLFGGGSTSFSFGGPLVTGGGTSSTLSKGFSFTSTSSTDSAKGGVGSSQETVVVSSTAPAPAVGGAAASGAVVSQDSDVAPEGGTGLALGEDKFDQPGPGEENEESLFNVRGKVMKFSGSAWADLGIGQIRVYKHKETGAKRIFARNSKSGRILLNFAPFAKMEPKIDEQKANFMRMTGMDDGRLVKILIKLKEAKEAAELVAALQKEVGLLS